MWHHVPDQTKKHKTRKSSTGKWNAINTKDDILVIAVLKCVVTLFVKLYENGQECGMTAVLILDFTLQL